MRHQDLCTPQGGFSCSGSSGDSCLDWTGVAATPASTMTPHPEHSLGALGRQETVRAWWSPAPRLLMSPWAPGDLGRDPKVSGMHGAWTCFSWPCWGMSALQGAGDRVAREPWRAAHMDTALLCTRLLLGLSEAQSYGLTHVNTGVARLAKATVAAKSHFSSPSPLHPPPSSSC